MSAEVDVVFAEGAATKNSDRAEADAIKEVFRKNAHIPVTCPKSGFGHLFGASTAIDIICGLLASKYGEIPLTPNTHKLAYDINLITSPTKRNIKNFMVNSRAKEGGNVSLMVSSNL
jgi:3-oxoacyl-(acyl-carrier-protein) synthase